MNCGPLLSDEPHAQQPKCASKRLLLFLTPVSTVALFFNFSLGTVDIHYTDVSVDCRGVWSRSRGLACCWALQSGAYSINAHRSLFHFISFFASLTATEARLPGPRQHASEISLLPWTRGNIEGEVHFWFGFLLPVSVSVTCPRCSCRGEGPGDRGNCCSVCSHFYVLFLLGLATLPRAKRARISLSESEVLHVKVSSKEALPCHFLG